jgi:L,D-peptidoglycan transpeptidase YkuD (ErfK/YbiS/YcfS/YnhG family)
MRFGRALSTTGVVVAIGACAVTVVAVASTEPRDERGTASTPSPTPTTSGESEPAPSVAVPSTAPSTSVATRRPPAPRPTASSKPVSTRPARPKPAPPTSTPKPTPRPPSHPAAPRGQSLPLGYTTGSATRVVTVVASSTGSTTARLQAWTKAAGGGWLPYGSAVTAHVGSQGLTTQPSERKSATPIGSFTLTQAFGALGDPGTGLPYFRTDSNDWWVSDQNSRYYNQHYRCGAGSCPFDTSAGENLLGAGSVYDYAVVIDYNRFPAHQGVGSAFFLHVTNGAATAGCVAIPQDRLVSIMRWLTPGTHPRILIGVA